MIDIDAAPTGPVDRGMTGIDPELSTTVTLTEMANASGNRSG